MPDPSFAPVLHEECDVLVVGGGPAGSTIASLLAEKGWRVTLLEKEHHPRFHIGESLLPHNLPIFKRLDALTGALPASTDPSLHHHPSERTPTLTGTFKIPLDWNL